jgi:hypothetical protein
MEFYIAHRGAFIESPLREAFMPLWASSQV